VRQAIASATRHTLGVEDQLKATQRSFGDRLAALEQRAASVQGERPWQGFGEFVSAVRGAALRSGDSDKRLVESRAASGVTGGAAGSDGDFIIPSEFSNALMAFVRYSAPIASRATNIPAKRRSISLPAIDETSRANGSRWGGVQSSWTQEGDTTAASKPKFRRLELNLKRLMALLYATDELTEDGSALGAFIANAFTAEGAFQLDDMLINGTGSGQPLGMLNAPGLITVAKDAAQTADTVSATNVTNMFARMLPECRPNAVWLVSPEVEESLYAAPLVVGAAGSSNNLFTPGDSDAPFGRLMSRPILPVEQCSALGTVGDIIFADPSMLAVYERPLNLNLSMDVRFLNGESIFRLFYRVDAQPIVRTPITPKNGGPTKSAYVAVATRA
jgi:HK97 family phage major capsid protein